MQLSAANRAWQARQQGRLVRLVKCLPVQTELQASQADARSSQAGHDAKLHKLCAQLDDLQTQLVSAFDCLVAIMGKWMVHIRGIHICAPECSSPGLYMAVLHAAPRLQCLQVVVVSEKQGLDIKAPEAQGQQQQPACQQLQVRTSQMHDGLHSRGCHLKVCSQDYEDNMLPQCGSPLASTA